MRKKVRYILAVVNAHCKLNLIFHFIVHLQFYLCMKCLNFDDIVYIHIALLLFMPNHAAGTILQNCILYYGEPSYVGIFPLYLASFPVIHKVGNVVNFVLLRSEG